MKDFANFISALKINDGSKTLLLIAIKIQSVILDSNNCFLNQSLSQKLGSTLYAVQTCGKLHDTTSCRLQRDDKRLLQIIANKLQPNQSYESPSYNLPRVPHQNLLSSRNCD